MKRNQIPQSPPPPFGHQESDTADLKSWLRENGLEEYYQALLAKEVENLEDFTFFSRNELAEMSADLGMQLKIRRKFIKAVKSLTQSPPSYVLPQTHISTVLCSDHQTPVGLVCETDKSLVCYECLATTHNGHRFKALAKAASEEKVKIQNSLETLKQKLEDLQGGITKLKNAQSDISKRGTTVEKQIKTCYEKCRQICNERELKHIAAMKKIVNIKAKALSQQQSNLESILTETNQLTIETENIFSGKEDAELLQLWKNLAHRINGDPIVVQEPNISGDIFFYESPMLFPTLKRSGQVQNSNTSPEHTTSTGSGLMGFERGKLSSFTIIARDKQGRRRDSGGDMFRIELTSCNAEVGFTDKQDGTYIVSYRVDTNPDENGTQLSVLLGRRHIVGSPFSLRAMKVEAIDMSRVRAINASEEWADHKKENTLRPNCGCWASNTNHNQYIIYSLGGRRQLNGITLSWTRIISKQSSPKDIHIMVADDKNGPWITERKISRQKDDSKTNCDLSCTASFLKVSLSSNYGGARLYLSSIKFR